MRAARLPGPNAQPLPGWQDCTSSTGLTEPLLKRSFSSKTKLREPEQLPGRPQWQLRPGLAPGSQPGRPVLWGCPWGHGMQPCAHHGMLPVNARRAATDKTNGSTASMLERRHPGDTQPQQELDPHSTTCLGQPGGLCKEKKKDPCKVFSLIWPHCGSRGDNV